ncbi:MAG: hypothetical protein A3F14_04725 [Gammaproteobacteria bacterium RIFCSPHIGHO2_12_FULL_43_28]|nr:MAG: hypothetical protein A3F14_04725 [Gammaproteobacteria bacterium RIFCSPHIGHO2_12_FULL_43_28]
MTNNDLLCRFIFDNMPIRGEFIQLHDSFQSIINQHPYPSAIRRLLGEALCVAGLLSAIIKFDGRLSVQFRGSGKLKFLLAQSDNQFHLRALAKWEEEEVSYEELMESFNDGILVITLDSKKSTHQYQGVVPWQGNSLAESIEGYFRNSEQLATKLWLSVSETRAAGFLLQAIPTSHAATNAMEEQVIDLHWDRIVEATNAVTEEALLTSSCATVLTNLYPDELIRMFSAVPVVFQCTCSQKRSEDAILVLGQEEVEDELKNNRSIVVTCDFCNKQYIFDRVDIAKLFKDRDKPSSNIH